jgi:magnesium-transporting ATPase (P-type)
MGETTFEAVGNPTDVAFFKFLQDNEIPIHLNIQEKLANVLATVPFSSSAKFMATAVKTRDFQGEEIVTLYVKGAPEVVVKMCNSKLYNGENAQLNKNEHNEILGIVKTLAQQPLRVITFAFLQMDMASWKNNFERGGNSASEALQSWLFKNSSSLCYIGTFGLKDDLRPKIASVINFARGEGGNNMGVKLVSGDHIETAKRIAE